ncbi:hypothetical protein LSAT2_012765 [Lamellibrachia satsuma]|nr:hypothetical protein LSAT2_012765 [Lamellibrachia satsuma]
MDPETLDQLLRLEKEQLMSPEEEAEERMRMEEIDMRVQNMEERRQQSDLRRAEHERRRQELKNRWEQLGRRRMARHEKCSST